MHKISLTVRLIHNNLLNRWHPSLNLRCRKYLVDPVSGKSRLCKTTMPGLLSRVCVCNARHTLSFNRSQPTQEQGLPQLSCPRPDLLNSVMDSAVNTTVSSIEYTRSNIGTRAKTYSRCQTTLESMTTCWSEPSTWHTLSNSPMQTTE